MSLNEQLAVEVMGLHKVKHLWYSCPNPARSTEPKFSTVDTVSDQLETWNPTTDLNQLRMCYDAAEVGDVFFVERFLDALMVLIRPLCACNIVSTHELTHAIFKHPELVAQAILKARGVE